MGQVIVLGSFITDLVVRAPRLPLPGESLIGDTFGTFQGGKGFNQASAAARSGAEVTLIGRIGADAFGDAFLSVLHDEGMDATYVGRDAAIGTGAACVMIGADSAQNAIIVILRANLALTPEMVSATMQSILTRPNFSTRTATGPRIFMAQGEMLIETITTGLRLAHEAGMTTIFNAAPAPREPLAAALFSLIDILVVNESEAAALSGLPVSSPETARQAARQLLTLGARQVVITLGAQGSLWSTREANEKPPSHHLLDAIPVTPVDTTAAGDAFCGALAAGLASGLEMVVSLNRASAAGALTVTRMGAFPSLPRTAEVDALLIKQPSPQRHREGLHP